MILATGNRRRFAAGFSLLELLVAIFIVGLLSGVAIMNLPEKRGDQALRRAVEQTVAGLRQVRNQAVFSGQVLGLLWRAHDSLVVYRDESGWLPLEKGIRNLPMAIPEEFPLWLEIGGTVIDVDRQQVEPQILFLNDGQVSPFMITVQNERGTEIQFDQTLSLEPAS